MPDRTPAPQDQSADTGGGTDLVGSEVRKFGLRLVFRWLTALGVLGGGSFWTVNSCERTAGREHTAVPTVVQKPVSGKVAVTSKSSAVLSDQPDNFTALFNMAVLYAKETNAPAAIPWLRDAMKQISPSQYRAFLSLPEFDTIRSSAEFQDFLRSLDLAQP